jgi:NAD(P)-dependent dehydrogenase (short-subunit alcohol dehydrogenase family)
MMLRDRTAVVYGGGGSIGGAMARAFAREGATVHLAGRTQATLDRVAEQIRGAGGEARTAVLDALDEAAVDAHAHAVGRIDISVNVISVNDIQGTPLAEMSVADFESPIRTATRTAFLTTRAAARHMIPRRSGVILFFGGDGDPVPDYNIGGFQIALAAIESLRRTLASELGRHGIRVVSLRTGGIVESVPSAEPGADAIVDSLVSQTMLKRAATLEDVGNVAAFAASDGARSMTGTALNISCGALVD